MASILTNVGAMVALQTLKKTNNDLGVVQNRISTGMKVATAKDNSSYWSIASTMKSDVSALKALNENIAINSASVQTARVGAENINNLLDQVKAQLALATNPAVKHSDIANEIDNLSKQVVNTIKASSYNGENLLDNNGVRTLVVSINRTNAGITAVTDTITAQNLLVGAAPAVPTFTAATTDAATGVVSGAAYTPGAATVAEFVSGIKAALNAGTTGAEKAQMATVIMGLVDGVKKTVQDYAAVLGSTGTRLELQEDFTSKLIDSLNEGVGTLVDANLDEESARLQALQVQQQLGIQALSIANQAPQNILSLFR